ncbi:MAG: alpha/beta hydrolase [Pseudomonadota bacterium]
MNWVKRILFVFVVVYVALCFSACALTDRFAFYPDGSSLEMPEGIAAQQIEIETPDGETLVAIYAKAEVGCPTFLNFHGNAQHLRGLISVSNYYGSKGIGFLAPAYRGYSGSTGQPTERGVRIDGLAAFDTLHSKGLRKTDIIVRGFSLGSSVAIGVAAEREATALILGAPFKSGTRMGQEAVPILPMGLLAGNAFRSDRLAPQVKEPVLIIHGDADRVIPAAHSADLAETFVQPVQRFVLEGYGHNDLLNAEYEQLVAEFSAPFFPDCPSLQELAQ